MASSIITGSTADGGQLYACVDPEAHHVTGEPCLSRLSALLRPYRSEAEAKAGLEAAGAIVANGGGK